VVCVDKYFAHCATVPLALPTQAKR